MPELDAREQLLILERRTLKPLRQMFVHELVTDEDPERSMVYTWQKVYERREHSRVIAGKRRATALWHNRQADLCDIARLGWQIERSSASRRDTAYARQLRDEAQSVFLYSNHGYLMTEFVRRLAYQNTFESEDSQSAEQIILQEAREGMIDGMRRYDRHRANSANALTYCGNWARQRVFKALARDGKIIPFKHRESARRTIAHEIRSCEEAGTQVDVQRIAEKVDMPVEDVLALLPYIGAVGRLDAPVRETGSDGETLTVGMTVADTTVDLFAEHAAGDLRDAVSRAIEDINDPMQRAVFEMLAGVNGRERCRQADLFDGVYVNSAGEQFTSKMTIARSRHRLDRQGRQVVQVRAQSELSQGLREGRLKFVPGTPQAAELVRVAQMMGRSPWAPTSGSVQDALMRAERKVRQSRHLRAWADTVRYRGDNEIENSNKALNEVRDALVALGVCSRAEAARLKAGTLSGGKVTQKGSARVLGEKHGLIDPDSGRLTSRVRAAISQPAELVAV